MHKTKKKKCKKQWRPNREKAVTEENTCVGSIESIDCRILICRCHLSRLKQEFDCKRIGKFERKKNIHPKDLNQIDKIRKKKEMLGPNFYPNGSFKSINEWLELDQCMDQVELKIEHKIVSFHSIKIEAGE